MTHSTAYGSRGVAQGGSVFQNRGSLTTGRSLLSTHKNSTDKRYKTTRWKRVRLVVLNRDLWVCRIAPRCPERASVADHIIPVFDGMPDAMFFDPKNLRAGCKRHNTARGVAARLERETSSGVG